MADETTPKPSAVEVFKTESNYLAGEIEQELADGTDGFGKGSVQLLKNHGTYQQARPRQEKSDPWREK